MKDIFKTIRIWLDKHLERHDCDYCEYMRKGYSTCRICGKKCHLLFTGEIWNIDNWEVIE